LSTTPEQRVEDAMTLSAFLTDVAVAAAGKEP
jgi:hypothetical protein